MVSPPTLCENSTRLPSTEGLSLHSSMLKFFASCHKKNQSFGPLRRPPVDDAESASDPVARIPSLEELVQEALRLRLGVFFDIKDARSAEQVVKVFQAHDLYTSCAVVSFNPLSLRAVRRLDPRCGDLPHRRFASHAALQGTVRCSCTGFQFW